MMTSSGPKVIEFNCRFGDPECQALMPLMGQEFGKILQACALGQLEQAPNLSIRDKCSACIVIAASGYPENPKKGDLIDIQLKENQSLQLFHSGTKLNSDKKVISSGGRVLSVVAQGDCFDNAFSLAYKGINKIYLEDMIYRSDIGHQVRDVPKIKELSNK